jgi:hypothetical protein
MEDPVSNSAVSNKKAQRADARCAPGKIFQLHAAQPPDPQAWLPPESVVASDAFFRFFPPPPLKSVSYQPLPVSLKPAAETILLRVVPPQAGQSTGGESDIFCMTSCSWPQAAQRYS